MHQQILDRPPVAQPHIGVDDLLDGGFHVAHPQLQNPPAKLPAERPHPYPQTNYQNLSRVVCARFDHSRANFHQLLPFGAWPHRHKHLAQLDSDQRARRMPRWHNTRSDSSIVGIPNQIIAASSPRGIRVHAIHPTPSQVSHDRSTHTERAPARDPDQPCGRHLRIAARPCRPQRPDRPARRADLRHRAC